jgi:hypothetical protein
MRNEILKRDDGFWEWFQWSQNVFEDLRAVLLAIAGQSSAYTEDVLKGSY